MKPFLLQASYDTMDVTIPIAPSVTPSGHRFYDARNITDEDLVKQLLHGGLPIRFDWENRWLRGEQYAHMLMNIDAYRTTFDMPKLPHKCHPENIYVQPLSKCRLCSSWQTDRFTL
jgi:hypothetical protein